MVSPEPNYWIHVVSPKLVILSNPRPANGCLRELKSPKVIVSSRIKVKARQKTRRNRHRYPPMSPPLYSNIMKAPCKTRRFVPCCFEVMNNLRYSNCTMIMCVQSFYTLSYQLTHGSFTQIMSDLGQEALELQLERFFTVWAWSLNLEEIPDFGEHLGVHIL